MEAAVLGRGKQMTEPVIIGRAKLYLGCFSDVLESIPPVDLLCSDPPYKLTSGGQPESSIAMRGGWMSNYDNKGSPVTITHDWEEWLPLVAQVMAADSEAYIMANDKNLQAALNAVTDAGLSVHNVLAWDKVNATANRWYMKNLEFIVYAWKGRARRINDAGSKQLVRLPQNDQSAHPTEKPVALMSHYIGNSTQPGQLVFDPFMGSGTTGVAALQLGRNFVGCEIDERWFEVACDRIEDAQRQGDMFIQGEAA